MNVPHTSTAPQPIGSQNHPTLLGRLEFTRNIAQSARQAAARSLGRYGLERVSGAPDLVFAEHQAWCERAMSAHHKLNATGLPVTTDSMHELTALSAMLEAASHHSTTAIAATRQSLTEICAAAFQCARKLENIPQFVSKGDDLHLQPHKYQLAQAQIRTCEAFSLLGALEPKPVNNEIVHLGAEDWLNVKSHRVCLPASEEKMKSLFALDLLFYRNNIAAIMLYALRADCDYYIAVQVCRDLKMNVTDIELPVREHWKVSQRAQTQWKNDMIAYWQNTRQTAVPQPPGCQHVVKHTHLAYTATQQLHKKSTYLQLTGSFWC
jgi:hypothetical protein